MILKRIMCAVSAAVLLSCTSVTAFAAEDSSSVPDAYKADESMLTTDNSQPTLSFDMSDWKNYVFPTTDAALCNITTGQEKTYAYQGGTLKISAQMDGDLQKYVPYQGAVRDADGNLAYPDAAKEDAELSAIGVELHADTFGMNYFDGCMITFTYRLNQNAQGKLLDDSAFVFPMNDEGTTLASTPLQLKINTTESNNVTQYAKGVIAVSENVGATKLVFQVPVIRFMEKTDVLYVDNITVVTPVKDADSDMQVANVDGFNANAQPQEIVNGLKINEKVNDISSASSTAETTSSSSHTVVFVIIGVAVVAVAGVIVFMIKRHKNRFY